MPVRLGELLLRENMVSPQQLQDALNHAKRSGGKVAKAFVSLGFVKDEEITSLLSRQYGVPSINLDHFEVDPAIIKIIPAETARKYQVLPLSRSGATLTIAMADPTKVFAMDDIKFMTGYNVEPVVASESALEDAIDRYYGSNRSRRCGGTQRPPGAAGVPAAAGCIRRSSSGPTLSVDDMAAIGGLSEIDLDSMSEADADAGRSRPTMTRSISATWRNRPTRAVIKLTNVLLIDALKRGASDIHIEPYEKEFRVRFRIDGILYNVMALPMKLRDPLISRIKVMARLNIAEKRLAQDGRIKIKIKVEDRSRDLDFRVSVLPTPWGEKIVMRLLDRWRLVLDMTKLGFESRSLERFERLLQAEWDRAHHRAQRNRQDDHALLRDRRPQQARHEHHERGGPVDFNLPGINQVPINKATGENRRDRAAIVPPGGRQRHRRGRHRAPRRERRVQPGGRGPPRALDAPHERPALHGDALVTMGIDPYLVATRVNLIVSQRLVRRICSRCKVDATAEVSSKTLVESGFTPKRSAPFRSRRAEAVTCNGTGYNGRVGLYEVMEISNGIRGLIMGGATAAGICEQGPGGGNAHSPHERPREDEVRRDHPRGGPARDRIWRRHLHAEAPSRLQPLPNPARSPTARATARPRPSRRWSRGSAAPRACWTNRRPASGAIPGRRARATPTASSRGRRDVNDFEPGSLAVQLETANGELHCLRQRLFELNCSDIQTVQLANAKTEIDALRQRLFELYSYKIAYECLRDERSRPPMGSH